MMPFPLLTREHTLNPEKKQALIKYLQKEIQRHHWDTFVVDPPSVAAGGKGVVYPGKFATFIAAYGANCSLFAS